MINFSLLLRITVLGILNKDIVILLYLSMRIVYIYPFKLVFVYIYSI